MPEEAKDIQSIDWRRSFACLEILRSFRMSIHPVKLFLCFVGVAATFGLAVAVDQLPAPVGHTRLAFGLFEGAGFYDNMHRIVTTTLWGQWALPYVGGKSWDDFVMFVMSPLSAARDSIDLVILYWQQCPWFALINTVLALAIWAVIGTAVSRMAAVRIAREEAVGFALSKWPSTVSSPLIPFGVLVLLAALFAIPVGLILSLLTGVGAVVTGLFWFVALALYSALALVFIGGVFSLGLQWPTIAAEGSDSFDAISRSISYISSRPWRYIFYTVFSAVYGCLTFILVKLVAFLTLAIAHASIAKFTFGWFTEGEMGQLDRLWQAPSLAVPWPAAGAINLSSTEIVGSDLMLFWVWVVFGLLVAFLFSFFFTSQTVVYFLLRKVVDATDMEEVYMDELDEEDLPLEPKAEHVGGVAVQGEGAPPPRVNPTNEPQPPE
jgi:hypothetical protein